MQAEELIKQEMLVILRHDLVHHPPPTGPISKPTLTKVKADLEAKPLEMFSEKDLEVVCIGEGGGEFGVAFTNRTT